MSDEQLLKEYPQTPDPIEMKEMSTKDEPVSPKKKPPKAVAHSTPPNDISWSQISEAEFDELKSKMITFINDKIKYGSH